MNVIKDVTFEGRILDQIREAVRYLETQVKEHSYLGKEGRFVTDREYPQFVIQEMVVNSVCHRDYSIKGTEILIKMFDDRLVFETPGKLPGIVRPDNIRHTHFSRNPKIAEYLKAYEYVKDFGEGVDRMCRELNALGSEGVHYHLVAFIMHATAYAAKLNGATQETTQKNHDNVEKICAVIKDKPFISILKLSEECGMSNKEVRTIIDKLKENGILYRVGSRKDGCWVILTDNQKTEQEKGK